MTQQSPTQTPRRIVVADDSATMRAIISDALTTAGMHVVAQCANGAEAIEACERERPDALTLDLSMPGMGGMDVLRAFAARRVPVSVVVVSSFGPDARANAVDVLAEGATDLVVKPTRGGSITSFSAELVRRVGVAAAATPKFSSAAPMRPAPVQVAKPAAPQPRATPVASSDGAHVVAIAASTGGPRALKRLLELPTLIDLGRGGYLVQHMPPGFTAALAQRLDTCSAITVVEAKTADALTAGTLLVAPSGSHLRLGRSGRCYLSDAEPELGVRPCADLTVVDLAKQHGDKLIFVVLTGMGQDGLRGAHAVREQGGYVIAQAEADCTVFGMPRRVIEAGLADAVCTIEEIPSAIASAAKRRPARRTA